MSETLPVMHALLMGITWLYFLGSGNILSAFAMQLLTFDLNLCLILHTTTLLQIYPLKQ